MATHKIGIEVESKSSGSGFRKAEQDAKELNQQLRRLDKSLDTSNLDTYESRLKRSRVASETWVDVLRTMGAETRRQESRINRLSDATRQHTTHIKRVNKAYNLASNSANDYSRQTRKVELSVEDAFRAQSRAVNRTEELTLATAGGAQAAYKYFTKYTQVIGTLNRGRHHTVEMARAVGILGEETHRGSRQATSYGNELNELKGDLTGLHSVMHTLTLSIKNLTENLEKTEKRAESTDMAVDALGNEIQDAGERAYYLNEALHESEQSLYIWQNRAAIAEAKAAALGAEIRETGQDVDKASEEMRQAANQTDRFGDELGLLGQALTRVDGRLDKFDRGLDEVNSGLRKSSFAASAWSESFGNIISNVLQEAAYAAYQFATEAVEAFHEFDRGSREVFTLIPEASGEMRDALKADVLDLGHELGRLPNEMLPAVYDALSAGIPQENVLSAVATASDAARAGVADLDSTLKLGVAILNAQVGGVSNLEEVYDQLFFTVKNGVITMPEMTEGLNAVTSIAGEAGVSLQDISAALIVMTRQGDSAQEAFELLSIMLTQLSTSGTTLSTVFETAAGKSFRQFIAEGGNLAGAMGMLQQHATDTGQALGDILGGGSPFFRDTQAARGTLELTGKHLESLIHFAAEAEDQVGSMGYAAAEMGEVAELGALKAASAWETMKITIADAYSEEADAVFASKEAIAEYVSEDAKRKMQFDATVEAIKAQGVAQADLRLTLNAVHQGTTAWRNSMVDAETMARRTDIAVRLLSQGFEGNGYQLEELINLEMEQIDAAVEVGKSLENVDAKLMAMTANFAAAQNVIPPTVATLRAASEAALDLSSNLSSYGEEGIGSGLGAVALSAIEAKEEMIAANEDIAAASEARAARIAAAAEAERAAISASREAYNGYASTALESGEATTNWTDALFKSAGQMDINQSQYIALAIASGEYSEAQIRAALTEAAMRQAVEQLSVALAAGDITVNQAIDSIRDFEASLANDFTATLQYSDFEEAEAQAKATRDALLAAEGNYSASMTTTNTTINQVVNVPATGPGGGNPVAMHEGGQFGAHQLLMVGDGPGGKFIPGITEFVMFDKPGSVIGADESARLFSGQQLPPGLENSQTDKITPLINPGSEKGAGAQVTINVYLYEAQNKDITDSVLQALQRGGLVN